MPLAFQSKSHGEIVFGFFNIETDMLLLNNYFFFASDFCHLIVSWLNSNDKFNFQSKIDGWIIKDYEKIGDLMGAIHGIRFTGFIGEVYKIFPFPKLPENFKQNPEGYKTRNIVEKIIKDFGDKIEIPFYVLSDIVKIAEYEFTKEQFFELINYVIEGGYPKWKDGIVPDYVKNILSQPNI